MIAMKGPFALNPNEVNKHVPNEVPGCYRLGNRSWIYLDTKYVGRSDQCLNSRLKQHEGRFTHFEFWVAPSPREAFENECREYHAHGGAEGKLENKIHPAPPPGANWSCPDLYCSTRTDG